jgi:hypothetical protein
MKAKDELVAAVRGKGCLGKAHPDEPVFVLRGQDALAGDLVRAWADKAKEHGAAPGKVREARALAAQMDKWKPRKFPT